MSDNVQIILIISVALIIVLFIFRRQLSDFRFKGGKDGVDMQLKTKKTETNSSANQSEKMSSGTSISGNKLWGRKNKIDVQANNASVDDNQLIGEEQEISVRPKTTKKK